MAPLTSTQLQNMYCRQKNLSPHVIFLGVRNLNMNNPPGHKITKSGELIRRMVNFVRLSPRQFRNKYFIVGNVLHKCLGQSQVPTLLENEKMEIVFETQLLLEPCSYKIKKNVYALLRETRTSICSVISVNALENDLIQWRTRDWKWFFNLYCCWNLVRPKKEKINITPSIYKNYA